MSPETKLDLDALTLSSGEGRRIDLEVTPELGSAGEGRFALGEEIVPARVEISRTSSGFALRLLAAPTVEGTCERCLAFASHTIGIDGREVDQPQTEDPELTTPYSEEGLLDVGSWLRDAIVLGVPDQLLCREDCRGLCEICGISLNDVDPDQHVHERPRDPRFAKLRDLEG